MNAGGSGRDKGDGGVAGWCWRDGWAGGCRDIISEVAVVVGRCSLESSGLGWEWPGSVGGYAEPVGASACLSAGERRLRVGRADRIHNHPRLAMPAPPRNRLPFAAISAGYDCARCVMQL